MLPCYWFYEYLKMQQTNLTYYLKAHVALILQENSICYKLACVFTYFELYVNNKEKEKH